MTKGIKPIRRITALQSMQLEERQRWAAWLEKQVMRPEQVVARVLDSLAKRMHRAAAIRNRRQLEDED